MASFRNLTVTDIQKTTRDAVVLTLAPSDTDADFSFVQGQYLTFRRDFDGEELRRSYSICAGEGESTLQVGIKRVAGGAFSTWANETLQIGDQVEAMTPMGKFHTPAAEGTARSYLSFAGGSGITPVLSIMKTTLAQEPHSEITLVYANRGVSSIMFREELEDLKNIYMNRLTIIHILETDSQDIDLFTGRVDQEKCALLFKHWIDIKSVDIAYICGPEPMMLAISAALKDHGLDDDQIRYELFGNGQPGRAKRTAGSEDAASLQGSTEATVTLDGMTRTFTMPKDGVTLLQAAMENNMDVPHACKAGVCSTCRAKVLEGEVEMVANHALEDYEVEQGYVLTCQCYPLSDKIVIDYD
ncbi:MAG: 2Fe-2S iron-sulfur cluster-binding protein [Paracoccaceae bacterium]|jgi:ring-1,2-phenylacetyl-CoA epoxidase subunit PaaE